MLTGRRTFERADGWGGQHPWGIPAFVVTHHVPDGWPRPGSTVQFVTDGIEAAVARAKSAADPKSVGVHGAQTIQQCLDAGLLDEIHIDLAAVLLGAGVRLFDHLATHRRCSGIRQSSPVWVSRICAIPCTRSKRCPRTTRDHGGLIMRKLIATVFATARSSGRGQLGSCIESEHDRVRFLVAPISELAPLAHGQETALRQHTNRRGVVARSASVKRTGCLQPQELLEGTRGNATAPIFTADPIGDLAATLQVEARNVTHNSTVDLDDPVRRRGVAPQPRPPSLELRSILEIRRGERGHPYSLAIPRVLEQPAEITIFDLAKDKLSRALPHGR